MNAASRPSPARSGDLSLRASAPADAQALTDLSNLPGYRHGTLRLPFQSLAQTSAFLEGLRPIDLHILAFVGDQLIGSAGLAPGIGRRRHSADLGIGVHDDHVGQGIGTALMAALIDSADNWLDLKRIELTVFADNEAAIGLYAKFGFEREGLLRGYAFRNGAYADVVAMARCR
jgi:putative acetyltransferase